jgi:hypothetical protein
MFNLFRPGSLIVSLCAKFIDIFETIKDFDKEIKKLQFCSSSSFVLTCIIHKKNKKLFLKISSNKTDSKISLRQRI